MQLHKLFLLLDINGCTFELLDYMIIYTKKKTKLLIYYLLNVQDTSSVESCQEVRGRREVKVFPFFFLLPASASLQLDVLSLGVYIFSCAVLGVEARLALMKCGEKLNRRLTVWGHLGNMSSLQQAKVSSKRRMRMFTFGRPLE